MKVGLIVTAMDEKKAGIGWYCYNLVRFLKQIDNENDYILIHRQKNCDPIYQSCKEIIIPYPKVPMKKTIGDNFQMAFKLRKFDFDLVHELAHSGVFMFNLPFKKIITIHDVTPLLFPKTFDKFTVFIHKHLLPRSLKKADAIIAVSENTKKDVIKYYKIPEEKIVVVYNGIDHSVFKVLDKNQCKLYLAKKYGITYPFILSVGTIEPRKNYITLVRAFYEIKEKIPHKLVIVGKKGWKYNKFFDLISKLNLWKRIILVGYIPYEDLPAFYNSADVFVYPSIYEGFGLPPLEAMACGCPVIVSNTSSFPEIVGDSGILVNPYATNELAEKIYEVIVNSSLRKRLICSGKIRAKDFSWEKTARETLEVYREVWARD